MRSVTDHYKLTSLESLKLQLWFSSIEGFLVSLPFFLIQPITPNDCESASGKHVSEGLAYLSIHLYLSIYIYNHHHQSKLYKSHITSHTWRSKLHLITHRLPPIWNSQDEKARQRCWDMHPNPNLFPHSYPHPLTQEHPNGCPQEGRG